MIRFEHPEPIRNAMRLALGLALAGAMLAGCRTLTARRTEPTASRPPAMAIPDRARTEDSGQAAIEPQRGRQQIITQNLKLGRLEEVSGRPGQAKQFYRRVLRLDPENTLAQQRLAAIAQEQVPANDPPARRSLRTGEDSSAMAGPSAGLVARTAAIDAPSRRAGAPPRRRISSPAASGEPDERRPLLPWAVVQRKSGLPAIHETSPFRLTAAEELSVRRPPATETPTSMGAGHLPLWTPNGD